jgi:hypothetical protein
LLPHGFCFFVFSAIKYKTLYGFHTYEAQMNRQDSEYKELSVLGIETRVIKEFLDIFILSEIKNSGELTGYNLALLLKQRFDIALSPGTVYMTMYSMERRGLIVGHINSKKTTYGLTIKGERALVAIKVGGPELVDFMKCVFPLASSN